MKNMRLKLARVEMNLSQEELAAKVNVTRPTINLLEGGKFNPSLQLCISILMHFQGFLYMPQKTSEKRL